MVKLESTLMRFMLELVTRTNIYIYDMTWYDIYIYILNSGLWTLDYILYYFHIFDQYMTYLLVPSSSISSHCSHLVAEDLHLLPLNESGRRCLPMSRFAGTGWRQPIPMESPLEWFLISMAHTPNLIHAPHNEPRFSVFGYLSTKWKPIPLTRTDLGLPV
jgi:hypothetical protein